MILDQTIPQNVIIPKLKPCWRESFHYKYLQTYCLGFQIDYNEWENLMWKKGPSRSCLTILQLSISLLYNHNKCKRKPMASMVHLRRLLELLIFHLEILLESWDPICLNHHYFLVKCNASKKNIWIDLYHFNWTIKSDELI